MIEGSTVRSVAVPPEAAGQRIDFFLSHSLADLSRSQIQKLIAGGSVLVNGRAPQKRYLLSLADTIEVRGVEPVSFQTSLEPQDIPLSILFEDDHLIAVDKPAGLVVHPGSGNRTGTLVNALLHRSSALSEGFAPDRPGIVHRLDKETSGVLIVAKTNAAHAALARAFSAREIKKVYIGLCVGAPGTAEGIIDVALARSRREPVKRVADKAGKSSQTEYRMLGSKSGIAIVQFMPRTGRTHQIRVHCSVSGFPILGDALYGGGKERLQHLTPSDRPFAASILKCFARHALHARSIAFLHPLTRHEITIEAPLPQDFSNALRLFGSERSTEV